MPTARDDAIKGVHMQFYESARECVTAEDLQAMIPLTMPSCHLIPDVFAGIAQYLVNEWELKGMPKVTTASWAKLCIKILENDLTNLPGVFAVAKKYENAPSGAP